MVVLGVMLLVVGFVLMVPSGSVPGSVAIRNVRIGSSHVMETPGHRAEFARRTKWTKVLLGVALFGLGLLLIAFGS